MTGVPALSFLKAFLYDFFAKVPASLSEEAEVFTCSSPGLHPIQILFQAVQLKIPSPAFFNEYVLGTQLHNLSLPVLD